MLKLESQKCYLKKKQLVNKQPREN